MALLFSEWTVIHHPISVFIWTLSANMMFKLIVYHVYSWDWYHCLSILNVWTHCNHVYWLEWIDCDSMITDDFNRLIRVHAVMQYSQHDFLECIVIISSSGLNFGNGFKLISGFAINVWMPASWEYSHHAFNVLNTDCWMSSWFMIITML